MDTLQRVMNTFKQFEKKLDKIQADVNFHGHTLTDLKSILTSIPAVAIAKSDGTTEQVKYPVKRSIASQYEDVSKKPVDFKKTKRNNAVQPLSNIIKERLLEKHDSRIEKQKHLIRRGSPRNSPKQFTKKLLGRPRIVEPPRKGKATRAQKVL